jgi:hypothetical protein
MLIQSTQMQSRTPKAGGLHGGSCCKGLFGPMSLMNNIGTWQGSVVRNQLSDHFSGTALGGRILAASGNDYQGLIVFAAESYRRCAADGAMFGRLFRVLAVSLRTL